MSNPAGGSPAKRQSVAWDVSAQDLPDALERYLVGMADLYEISGISDHDRTHFYNRSRATLTTSGGIGEGYSVRQTLSRSPATLRRSSVDGLNLIVNETACVGDFNGRTVRTEPGALQFRDMGRVSSSRLDSVALMTLMIPRNLVPAPLLEPAIHGLALSPDQPGARLVSRHMRVLIDEAADLEDAELDTAVQALLLIAGRVAGVDVQMGAPEVAALQGSVRRAAVDYVEARLVGANPDIAIDQVAAAAGVSRATLYRSFGNAGGVNRYIQDRRLHHAQVALRRRRGMKPSIADIAWTFGFASESHFTRLFVERYGYRPSEVSPPKTEFEVVMSDGPIRHDLLGNWLSEISSARP
jgi:AraC-like DNA-binding protein